MMASIRRWLLQRFRWITVIPLLLVLVGIGVQALAGIGDTDTYVLQGVAWVVYLMAMVGLVESGTDAKSRRASRGRGRSSTSAGATGRDKRTKSDNDADRPRGTGRSSSRSTETDAHRDGREPAATPRQRTSQPRRKTPAAKPDPDPEQRRETKPARRRAGNNSPKP